MLELSHAIEVHLVYASVVWIAAWLLTSMNRGSATTKYWIWVATSLNFLLPLTVIPGDFWPARVSWFQSRIVDAAANRILLRASATNIVVAVWLLGAALMLARLVVRIVAERGAIEGPSTVGILRPRIILPHGIERHLTRRELEAVLIHERIHAKRRDNLIRLMHEISSCVLWFLPLVRITGSRLALYRELSCDESVAARGLGDDLVRALAKFAEPENEPLLQATASSFLRDRLEKLIEPQPPRSSAAIALTFAIVLLLSTVGIAAQGAARALCAETHREARHASLGSSSRDPHSSFVVSADVRDAQSRPPQVRACRNVENRS